MGWGHVAGAIGALVANAAIPMSAGCAGKVVRSESTAVEGGNVGTFLVTIGADDGVNVSFEESTPIPGAAPPSGTTFLGTLDDETRECVAYAALDPPPSSPFVTRAVSAGPITMTGGQAPLTLLPVVADAGADTLYAPNDPTGTAVFLPGDVATIAGQGSSDVPAFNETLPIPNVVTWTSPSTETPWTVARSQDLPVAWTGGGSFGSVKVSISVNTGMTTTVVTCTFAESTAGGALPAALLDMLPRAASGASPSSIAPFTFVSVQNDVSTITGGWTFDAKATATILFAPVTLE